MTDRYGYNYTATQMPQIVIYYSPSDASVVRKAKEKAAAAGAKSLSSVAMEAIRKYAATPRKQKAVPDAR